jgi:hypothetical protein
LRDQNPFFDAVIQARIPRFVPCNRGTSATRGIFSSKGVKEEVHDHLFRSQLGFTIIDIGFWDQACMPRVLSVKFDHVVFMPIDCVVAGGAMSSMVTDVCDVGQIAVENNNAERTLTKKVTAYRQVLTQNDIQKLWRRSQESS